MSPANLPVLGILLGDPAGVGPEIIAKLCVNGFLKENCRPVLIGDRRVLERAFGVIGASADIRVIDQIDDAVNNALETKGKPSVIIMKTVKGKGVSFMENQVSWHGAAPNEEQYNIAMNELRAHLAELEK